MSPKYLIATTLHAYTDGRQRGRVLSGDGFRSRVDKGGNVVSLTPPGRSAHTFGYGWRDRLEAYNPPATSTLSTADSRTPYAHYVQGMPESVTRPDGTYAYGYDHARRGGGG
jgi:hypothetical protein